MFPTNSERLIGISDAFFALCLRVSVILPTCSLNPQLKHAYSALHPQALNKCSPLDFQRLSIAKDGLLPGKQSFQRKHKSFLHFHCLPYLCFDLWTLVTCWEWPNVNLYAIMMSMLQVTKGWVVQQISCGQSWTHRLTDRQMMIPVRNEVLFFIYSLGKFFWQKCLKVHAKKVSVYIMLKLGIIRKMKKKPFDGTVLWE